MFTLSSYNVTANDVSMDEENAGKQPKRVSSVINKRASGGCSPSNALSLSNQRSQSQISFEHPLRIRQGN